MYHPERQNELANALSRREQKLNPQTAVKEQLHYKPLLTKEQLSPEVAKEISIVFLELVPLIDKILQHNRESTALNKMHY